jgi:hypothetical protein
MSGTIDPFQCAKRIVNKHRVKHIQPFLPCITGKQLGIWHSGQIPCITGKQLEIWHSGQIPAYYAA